ncbi:MAG: CDP-alcohol phosphatidyltransferase family protein [Chloroflexi bacterium]|nr:CDP-alcohol phosphatidyltransferase family protein [Chloroflexota bacterium]
MTGIRVRLLPGRAPERLTTPLVRPLAALGVSPHAVSVAALAGSLGAAVLIARGELALGGAAMLAAAALDSLDGALARLSGRASRLGALLDSTFDRIAEAAVLGALLYHQLGLGHREESMLAFTALAGSLLVSYVRARAEAEGVIVADGLLARTERVLLLGAGLITGWIRVALWLLAVLALLTAAQRLLIAGKALRDRDAERDGEP